MTSLETRECPKCQATWIGGQHYWYTGKKGNELDLAGLVCNNHGDETCINPCMGFEGGVTWKDRMTAAHLVTREECQEMIDDAIRRHNRNAGIISMFVGFFILGLFSEGLLRLIGAIPPLFPWMDIHL